MTTEARTHLPLGVRALASTDRYALTKGAKTYVEARGERAHLENILFTASNTCGFPPPSPEPSVTSPASTDSPSTP